MESGTVGHNFEMGLPKNYPSQICLIWFSGLRGKDLNVIFYQNMPNLHIRYKSAEKNFTEKPGIYVKLLLACIMM